MMDMESRPFQAMPENEYSPCSIEHQDVFMYEDEKNVRTSLTGERADSPTYLDISASKTSAFTNMKTESDPDTLLSWTHKHPEHWSQNEILDWIYFVASEIKVDPATIRGEGFQNISGPELCRMTLDDFKKADPVNGQFFYEMFHELHKDAFFISPSDLMDSNMCQQITAVKADIKQEFRVANCDFVDQKTDLGIDNIVMNGDELQVLIGQMWYPIDPYMTGEIQNIIDSNPLPETDSSSSGYASSCSDYETMSECSDSNIDTCRQSQYPSARTGSCGSEIFSDDEMSSMLVSDDMKKETSPKRKAVQKRKQKSVSKGNHLWEFIRDLLKDSKYNPHLLRWEEKETGVFRFVQSEAVAQMWGRKKNNPGMTYEKLSRAMRYYYKRGILDRVDGRRLVYKFGVNSHGWK